MTDDRRNNLFTLEIMLNNIKEPLNSRKALKY